VSYMPLSGRSLYKASPSRSARASPRPLVCYGFDNIARHGQPLAGANKTCTTGTPRENSRMTASVVNKDLRAAAYDWRRSPLMPIIAAHEERNPVERIGESKTLTWFTAWAKP